MKWGEADNRKVEDLRRWWADKQTSKKTAETSISSLDAAETISLKCRVSDLYSKLEKDQEESSDHKKSKDAGEAKKSKETGEAKKGKETDESEKSRAVNVKESIDVIAESGVELAIEATAEP